ncbi:TBC1 domain family member 15 [Galdieria sulphuraria]|nr:TBC1 domain family member 15 [Galdieria sulphuraria]
MSVHSPVTDIGKVDEDLLQSSSPNDQYSTESTRILFFVKSVQFNLGKVTLEHCKIPGNSEASSSQCPDVYLSNQVAHYKLEDWLDLEHTLVVRIQSLLACIVEGNSLEFILQDGTRGPIFRFRQVKSQNSLLCVLQDEFLFYPCDFSESSPVGLFIRKEQEWLECLPNEASIVSSIAEQQGYNTTNISNDRENAEFSESRAKTRFLFPMEIAERLANIARITREARNELFEKLGRSPKSRNDELSELSLEKLQKCAWPLDIMNESLLEEEEQVSYAVRTLDKEEDLPEFFKDEMKSFIPLRLDTLYSYQDEEGRIFYSTLLEYIVFRSTCHDCHVRRQIWPYLLQIFPWHSNSQQRQAILLEKTRQYRLLKSQWQNIIPEQELQFRAFRERRDLIEKDVIRTDRNISIYEDNNSIATHKMKEILLTYSFYNFDIGYCQGMSDILSPILFVFYSSEEEKDKQMEEEQEVYIFWCFSGLMQRIQSHFCIDQSGMSNQLARLKHIVQVFDSNLAKWLESKSPEYIFCFRWLLVLFKREFVLEDVLKLWDVFFCETFAKRDLNLFVAAGLLVLHRERIIREQMDFDDLIRYIHDMSLRIDVHLAIRKGIELQQRYYTHQKETLQVDN